MDFGEDFDDLNQTDLVHYAEDHLEDDLNACNIVTNRYAKYRRPHCDPSSMKHKDLDLNVMITDGDVFCETIKEGEKVNIEGRRDRRDCQQAVVRMYGVDADEHTYLINIRNF